MPRKDNGKGAERQPQLFEDVVNFVAPTIEKLARKIAPHLAEKSGAAVATLKHFVDPGLAHGIDVGISSLPNLWSAVRVCAQRFI